MGNAYRNFEARWLFKHIDFVWCGYDITDTSKVPEVRLPQINFNLVDVVLSENYVALKRGPVKGSDIYLKSCKIAYHGAQYVLEATVETRNNKRYGFNCRLYAVQDDRGAELMIEYTEYF